MWHDAYMACQIRCTVNVIYTSFERIVYERKLYFLNAMIIELIIAECIPFECCDFCIFAKMKFAFIFKLLRLNANLFDNTQIVSVKTQRVLRLRESYCILEESV